MGFLRLGAASVAVSISDADGFRVNHGTDGVTLLHVPAERMERGDWDRMWSLFEEFGARPEPCAHDFAHDAEMIQVCRHCGIEGPQQ